MTLAIEDSSRRSGRRGVAWIALGATAIFLALSLRPPIGSETRYIEASREMFARGDWLVPHLAGVPYFEKPVLVYWAGALSQAAFGFNWLAARLPSIAASVVSLVVTYLFARQLRGPRFALAAAGLLLSSGLFLVMGCVLTADPLFCAWLALAWWAFWRHLRTPAGRSIWLFWTALGLAMLTKGPLALVLTAASLGTYLSLTRRLRGVLSMRLVRGLVIVVLVNLPWHALVWAQDPRFLEFFYVRQNLHAFSDGRINHDGPVWYYLPVLVGGFFPWSALLVVALPGATVRIVRDAVRRSAHRETAEERDSLRVYLVCIVVPGLLFLSAASSKLPTYLLPLFPALAVLLADWIAAHAASLGRSLQRAMTIQAAVLMCVAAAMPFATGYAAERTQDLDPTWATLIPVSIALVSIGAAGGAYLVRRNLVVRGLIVVGASASAAVLLLDTMAFAIDPHLTSQRLIARVARDIAPQDLVVVASRLTGDYAISLELNRRFAILGKAGELGMGHFTELRPHPAAIPDNPYGVEFSNLPESDWLFDFDRLTRQWREPRRVWFIARPQDLAQLQRRGVAYVKIDGDGRRQVVSNRRTP